MKLIFARFARDIRYLIFRKPISKYPNISISNLGFTLIEVIVVLGIVAILSVILVEMFIGQSRIYQAQFSELIVANDARAALDDIDNHVRGANRVLSTYSTYNSGSNTLILQIQSINVSNQLIPGTFDTVVFSLTSGELIREVFPDAASVRQASVKTLSKNVTSLTFTYNNADFTQVNDVETSVTITSVNQVQGRAITVSTKSHLRNY